MTYQIIHTETASTDFYNLKNKADGARRYGYVGKVIQRTVETGDGSIIHFRHDYQTTLDGVRYQSSKHGNWVATETEARTLLAKTIKGALKRYAKLALDPASKIVERVSLSENIGSTTWSKPTTTLNDIDK